MIILTGVIPTGAGELSPTPGQVFAGSPCQGQFSVVQVHVKTPGLLLLLFKCCMCYWQIYSWWDLNPGTAISESGCFNFTAIRGDSPKSYIKETSVSGERV